MPDWLILVVALVGFFSLCALFGTSVMRGIARTHRPFREELERAAALAESGGVFAEGRVLAWEGGGGSPREGLDGMHLTVEYEVSGATYRVRFPVWIDQRVALDFAPGKTVPLLVDAADPERIAIDRRRAVTDVPLG